jgi:hypothetical protein
LRCKGEGRLAGGKGEPIDGPRVAVREKEERGEGAGPAEVNGPEEERGWAAGGGELGCWTARVRWEGGWSWPKGRGGEGVWGFFPDLFSQTFSNINTFKILLKSFKSF